MRRILILLSFALAVILVVMAVFGPNWGARANDPSSNETAAVEQIDVTILVSTSGVATPERTALLSFGTTGPVAEVFVSVGDAVSAQDVLARIDSTKASLAVVNAEQALSIAKSNYDRLTAPPTAAQRAAAEAAVAAASTQLAAARNSRATAPEQQLISCLNVDTASLRLTDAQQTYDDYLKTGLLYDAMFEADPNSPVAEAYVAAQNAFDIAAAQCRVAAINAVDTGSVEAAQAGLAQAEAQLAALDEGPSETEIAVSEAQVRQAEVALEQAMQTLDDMNLRASFDGIVTEQPFRVGQLASPGTSSIAVVNLDTLYFEVSVDELDIPLLKPGQTVEIQVDALNDEIIEGVLTQVVPAGRVVQGVTTYNVRIDMPGDRPSSLLAGMSADVDIIVGRETGVLAVPTRAIQRDEGEEYILVRVADAEPRRVTVQTGQTVGELTVIKGEIAEGDIVFVDVPQATIFRFGGPGGR